MRDGNGPAFNRVALVCTECLELRWVEREGIVLVALKTSRRFYVCHNCE